MEQRQPRQTCSATIHERLRVKPELKSTAQFAFSEPVLVLNFRKFLPMPPPQTKETMPLHIREFLTGRDFATLSLDEQESLRQKIERCYSGHFSVSDVVDYLARATKYEKDALELLVRAYGSTSDVINWYRLVREVYRASRLQAAPPRRIDDTQTTAVRIQQLYRKWKQRRESLPVVRTDRKELSSFDRDPEHNDLLLELRQKFALAPESLKELFASMDKNGNGEISREEFDQAMAQLEVKASPAAINELFRAFDKDDREFFSYSQFLSLLFHAEVLRSRTGYLDNLSLLLQEINLDLREHFPALKDFEADFRQHQEALKEFNTEVLEGYFEKLLKRSKYSRHQLEQVFRFVGSEKFIGKLYVWRAETTQKAQPLTTEKTTAVKEHKNKNIQSLVALAYFLVGHNDLKDKAYSQQEFIEATREVSKEASAKVFFTLFKGLNKLIPYYLNVRLGVAPISARLYRQHDGKELRELQEEVAAKFASESTYTGKQVGMIIYENFQERMTDLDYRALGIELKGEYNIHAVLARLFDFKTDRVVSEILRALATKVYGCWRRYKKHKRQALKLGLNLLGGKIMQIVNEPATDSAKVKLRKTAPPKSPTKTSRSSASSKQPKSEFEADALKLINNLIDGLNCKPPKTPVRKTATKEYLHVRKTHEFSYRTNLTHFSTASLVGGLFLSDSLLVFSNGEKKEIKFENYPRPFSQVLDFIATEENVILLRSSLHLDFYDMQTANSFPTASIRLANGSGYSVEHLNRLHPHRLYNKYPYLLRCQNGTLFVNTTGHNNRLYRLETTSRQVLGRTRFSPENYIVSQFQKQVVSEMRRVLATRQMNAVRVIPLVQFPMTKKAFKHLLTINFPNIQRFPDERKALFQLLEVTGDEVTVLQAYLLRSLLGDSEAVRELPERFQEPHELLHSYMLNNNISLLDLFYELDENNLGHITYKSFKNFLQKLYSGEEFQNIEELLAYIDSSGKISYHAMDQFVQSICSTQLHEDDIKRDFVRLVKARGETNLSIEHCRQMFFPIFQYVPSDIDHFLETLTYDRQGCLDMEWFEEYSKLPQQCGRKLWQRPNCAIQDFAFFEDYRLLVHTVAKHNRIFVADEVEGESRILCVLKGHGCELAPIFHYIPQSMLLVSGDQHAAKNRPSSLYIWNLESALISCHSFNPPWTILPTKVVENIHTDSLSCISFAGCSGLLITASLDSTIKCWALNTSSKELEEVHRHYQAEVVCIGCEAVTRKLEKVRPLERLVCLSVEKTINKGNRNQIAASAEQYCFETIKLEVAEEVLKDEIPTKLRNELEKLGDSIFDSKEKAEKLKVFELQKETRVRRSIVNSFLRQFFRCLKRYIIFGEQQPMQKVLSWMRQLYGGVSFSQFKQALIDAGLSMHLKPEELLPFRDQLSFRQEAGPDQTAGYLPLSLMLSNITSDAKQRIKRQLERLQKDTLTQSEFYEVFARAQVGTTEDLRTYFEMVLASNSNPLKNRVVLIEDIYKSILGQSSKKETPATVLRKLNKQLRKQGVDPWRLFSENREKLAYYRYRSAEEFRVKLRNLTALSDSEIQILLTFFESSKGISLKRFVDCLTKASYYLEITPSMGATASLLEGSMSPRERGSTQQAGNASPRQLDMSEYRSVYMQDDRNFSQLSDLDPNSVPLEETVPGITNGHSDAIPFKGKNFSILDMPRLTQLRQQLASAPVQLKEILKRCEKAQLQKGRIEESKFRQLLAQDRSESELDQLMKEIKDFYGGGPIDYETVLPQLRNDSDLELLCCQLHECLRHNTLNISQKEYLRMFKIEEINKGKVRHLLKKLKLNVPLDMEEELVKYLNCVRAISVEEFLRKIHPKQYPKPSVKPATAEILLQEKEAIIGVIIEWLEETQDFNVLHHVPFSLLRNTLLNPKYQLNTVQLTSLEEYVRKLRKQEYKFVPTYKESELRVNLPLLFDQLAAFLNPNADTHSMSSSSLSMSKESSAPKDMHRKSSKNIGQSQASNTSELSQRINDIVHRGQAKLQEMGKSIWEVLSAVQPDWMEGERISKAEFFRVFDSIDPGLRLREKVELLRYCDREKTGEVDTELLLEAFENKSLQGTVDRFIFGRIAQIMELQELKLQRLVANLLSDEHLAKEKITSYEVSRKFGEAPFFFPSYVLKELFRILSFSKKLFDDQEEVCQALEAAFKRAGIELSEQTTDLLRQICSHLDVDGKTLEQLFPISSTGKVGLQYLAKQLAFLNPNEAELEQLWRLLIGKLNLEKKVPEKKLQSFTMAHSDLLRLLREMVQTEQFSKVREASLAKRIVKAIEHRQLSLFEFFLLVDKAKKGSVSELEFNNGLRELGIFETMWRNIPKRNPKWLAFGEFVRFLIRHEACDISIADTDLEIAMSLFIKKVIGKQRIDRLYQKLAQFNGQLQEQTTWQSFHQYLQSLRVLKPQQEQLIFSALVNADQLSRVRLGNDALLKNEDNLKQSFSYRQLVRLYYHFTRKNIKKTALFKLQQALLKRRVSLFQEMMNFMQANRKNKEVADSLKNKELVLSRQLAQQFFAQLNTGLSEKDIKECLLLFDERVNYNDLQARLERVYQSASNDSSEQQTLLNAHRIYDCIAKLGSTVERLCRDFNSSGKNSISLADFSEICGFVNSGLNKIQVKEVFELADEAKKGTVSSYELSGLFEEARKTGDRPEEKVEIEEIVMRVMAGRSKLKLPAPTTVVSEELFTRCFEPVLNTLEIARLQAELRKKHGKFLDGQKLQEFIEQQVQQSESKTHRKARSLIKKLLGFLNEYSLTTKEWFRYFTQGAAITKSDFFTLLQTLPFRLEVDDIADLFGYIDEGRIESISLEALQYKLDVAVLFNEGAASHESTKLYYKVKQKLQEIYMHFVKKLFRDKQIYSFFDANGSGELTGRQLLNILQEIDVTLEDNEKNKLVKYLAKDQAGTISVANLLRELKSCLPNQTKEVLETKTYQIFKQHQDAIQEQPRLFVDRLLDCEVELRHVDGRGKEVISKGIREKDLFNLLKDFGVLLSEEELQDMRANFGLGPGLEELDLQKLYALIDSVLSGTTKHERSLQVARYSKLLRYFKSKNITFRQVESIVNQHGSARGLQQVLQSLRILRPIEVKRLVDPLVLPGTTQVDLQLFKDNLLSSYYGEYKEKLHTQSQSQETEVGEIGVLGKLKEQLFKRNSNANFWTNELGSRSAMLSKDTFEETLINSGIILSKKDINAALKELSDERGRLDRLKVMKMLGKASFDPTLHQFKEIEEVNENEHHDRIYQLLDHVCASLNYREASLLECLRECGCDLEGKCTIEIFMEFLRRTGYDQSQSDVQEVLSLSGLPVEYVEAQQLQRLMLEMGFKIDRLSEFVRYGWVSSVFKAIGEYIERNKIDLARNVKAYCDREEMISWRGASNLLNKYAPECEESFKIALHWIFRTEKMPSSDFLDRFEQLLRNARNAQLPQDNPMLGNSQCCFIMERASPVRNTENSTARMGSAVDRIFEQKSRPTRSMKLVANTLLATRILAKLQAPDPVPFPVRCDHPTPPMNFFSIGQYTQTTILLEEVRALDKLSYIVNGRYIGFKDLKLCEDRLKVELVLRSNSAIDLAENFYCVPLGTHGEHCSGAINLNWPAIAQFGRLILQQISTVHKHGYCLTNLRWNHLDQQKAGIVTSDYPCRMDNMGRLLHHQPPDYDPRDPFVSPELLYRTSHDFKIDTWVFGCLMVKFVFGCDPESIHLQIHSDGRSRMHEPPSNFSYMWLSESILQQILCYEHNSAAEGFAADIFAIRSCRMGTLIHRVVEGFRRAYSHLPSSELESGLRLLRELLLIIDSCLAFNPEQRPTVSELLALPLFEENKNIKLNEVFDGLSKMVSVRALKSQFEQLKDKEELVKTAPGVKRSLTLLEKKLRFVACFFQKYRGVYLPESAVMLRAAHPKNSLPENVLTRIQNYRLCDLSVQNGFINYMFSIRLLKNLVVEVNRECNQAELNQLHALFCEISEHLKTYSSGMAYYSVQFLMALLMACFGQVTDFLSESTQPENLFAELDHVTIKFKLSQRKSFINLYKRIVGSNGQPSIDFLPIYETVTSSPALQQYFHTMYVVLALYCSLENDLSKTLIKEDAMAKIEFLTQTLESEGSGQYRATMDGKCPALLIFYLQEKDYCLREKALHFYHRLSARSQLDQIFRCHAVYIPLFGRLRSSDELVSNKALSLQIMINLLDTDDREVVDNLNDCSYAGIEEALRLSIEPLANSPERSIHHELKSLLEELCMRLRNEENTNCVRIVSAIPGSLAVLHS